MKSNMLDNIDNNSSNRVHITSFQIGRSIKKLRCDRHISLASLANSIGISEIELAKMEQGKTEFSNQILASLADYFDVGLGELLGFRANKSYISDSQESLPPPEETLILIRLFSAIKSPELRKLVIQHTRSILEKINNI